MNKKIIIGGSILIVIAVTLGSISYSSKISNPLIGLKGLFTIYMESKGYTVEQMGRGFQLKKGNESKLLVSEGFMGIYEILVSK